MVITELYLALIVGLVLSLLIDEVVGINCGGIVVAGYLSLVCDDIVSMLAILLVVLLDYFTVEFILPKFMILFGKRKFVACLLVGMVLKILIDFMVPVLPFQSLAIRGIGIITPGIIANTCTKQGIHITIPATLVATYLTFGIVQLLMLVV